MNQEELKQRLIELVKASLFRHIDKSCLLSENIVNDLLLNGIMIRERGEWMINCDGYYPYCPKCMREPESGKMTDFCPHCGADMRGMTEQSEAEKEWEK